MKNLSVLILIMILVSGAGALLVKGSIKAGMKDGTVVIDPSGSVQRITLSQKNLNYYPQTVTVRAGNPVVLTLDNTVKGCLRAVSIPQLGVSKYLRAATDTLAFTPAQKGSFTIQCSMGMGRGKLVVQ